MNDRHISHALEQIGQTKFAAVNAVVKRARQLCGGATPNVPTQDFDKHVSTAIRELAAGTIAVRTGRGAKP